MSLSVSIRGVDCLVFSSVVFTRALLVSAGYSCRRVSVCLSVRPSQVMLCWRG